MDSTTRWIMIILLLLLIAAAVFMLLRSPGKDNGKDDGDDAVGGRQDAGHDRVPGTHEDRIEPAGATGGRGVYDQEADTHAVGADDTHPVADESLAGRRTDEAADDRATLPAADRMDEYAHPDAVDDRDRHEEPDTASGATRVEQSPDHDRNAADEAAEPYRPEAGAVEEDRPVEPARESSTGGMTDVHLLTDDEVDRGGGDEPLTRDDQSAGTAPEEPAAGEPGVGAEERRQVVDYQQGTLYDEGREHPVGDESTTYRAAGGDAVVVDDRQTGRDAEPADAGTGAPETADDIAEGRTTPSAGVGDTTEQGGYAPVFTEAAYGPGSAEPLDDGTGPAGWEVKGNIGSMLFHTPESPSYDAVRAEVWFESEDAARAAGFAHWDRRRR